LSGSENIISTCLGPLALNEPQIKVLYVSLRDYLGWSGKGKTIAGVSLQFYHRSFIITVLKALKKLTYLKTIKIPSLNDTDIWDIESTSWQ